MTDTAQDTARALGFAPEIVGGGAQLMARYWLNGAHIWASCLDGGGMMPNESNWQVCVYPAGWNGEPLARGHDMRSDDASAPRTFRAAMVAAINAAESLLPSTDALTDEYDAWIDATLPSATRKAIHNGAHISADELMAELQALNPEDFGDELAWLRAFIGRWNEAQEFEDFTSACAARGES